MCFWGLLHSGKGDGVVLSPLSPVITHVCTCAHPCPLPSLSSANTCLSVLHPHACTVCLHRCILLLHCHGHALISEDPSLYVCTMTTCKDSCMALLLVRGQKPGVSLTECGKEQPTVPGSRVLYIYLLKSLLKS